MQKYVTDIIYFQNGRTLLLDYKLCWPIAIAINLQKVTILLTCRACTGNDCTWVCNSSFWLREHKAASYIYRI